MHKNNFRELMHLAKVNGPDQNAMNLSLLNLTSPQISLLLNRPSFVPILKDINWCELCKDFIKFLNHFRFNPFVTKAPFSTP